MATDNKPIIFIGSTNEGRSLVELLEKALDGNNFNIKKWFQTIVFEAGKSSLENLIEQGRSADFAILLSEDADTLISREKEYKVPRDNLIFELGLFIGMLGKDRTFLVTPSDVKLKLPSDFDGVTRLEIDKQCWENKDDNVELSKITNSVNRRVRKYGKRKISIEELINKLDPINPDTKDREIESIVFDQFATSILDNVKEIARVRNKNECNLIRDICLYLSSPFEIQDVRELSKLQGNIEGNSEVWIFSTRIFDVIDPMYSMTRNNILNGVKFVFFQYSTNDFERLIEKLERDIGSSNENWRTQLICIIVSNHTLIPCDYHIYDPDNPCPKGYVSKSRTNDNIILVSFDSDNVQRTINNWIGFVRNCWKENSTDPKNNIFEYKEEFNK